MKQATTIIKIFIFQLIVLTTISGFSQSCPCCTPEHRQFDFWLGDWDVFVNDTILGTNHIYLSQDSCLLTENWSSLDGSYTGTSYNFYDSSSKTWFQTWVDNQGGNLKLEGEFSEGKMQLLSEPIQNEKGEFVLNRITWTPDNFGNVRQVWEVSLDLGETWQSFFDGLYVRKG